MLFSRSASFLTFAAAFRCIALGNPAVVKRADLSAVDQIVSMLKSNTDVILPQIQDLTKSGNVTDDTAVPLVDQLIDSFNNASTAIFNVNGGGSSSGVSKRQDATAQDIAQTTADILQQMTTAISALVQGSNGNVPVLGNRVVTLYTSTATLLTALDSSDGGFGDLLGSLLGSILPLITGLLGGLGGSTGSSSGGLGSLLGLLLGLLGL